MAKHEGVHDRHLEHARKRARGGETGEPELESQFTAQEAKDAEHPEPENEAERRRGGRLHHGSARPETEKEREEREKEEKRRRGGRIGHKKAGGHVHGEHPKARPDRRARGGATADLSPLTAAGKMSRTSYETAPQTASRGNEGGEGKDRD